ncbi:MAG: hypothetical protein EHM34_03375 [Nitrosopumilales archaeon]|nr:MAG: hypothetical protein EHM34_03375 [Nitrosopumilales archaeon]
MTIQKIWKAVSKFFGEMLCSYGVHDDIYYYEEHKCSGLSHIKTMNVPLRECLRCGRRQHHSMPKCAGVADDWRAFPYKKDSKLKFNNKR